jgi:glycosyltransferase involved in cell wall biosynthesis
VQPDVTICVPAFRAHDFIDRTLHCARAQTHERLRIVVSVDPSDDGTEDICRRHAREDHRVEVIVQAERLGWSQNTNAALARVETDFFCTYFHDDIIEPSYVGTLLDALKADPGAASAHCDLAEFGLSDLVRPAHAYCGSTLTRLVDFMMTRRGTTLRSLVRRRALARPLRYPLIHGDSHWTAYVFHLELLAAGPAVAIGQALYRRWQREDSLTRSDGWAPRSLASLLQGQRESHDLCLAIIRGSIVDPDERRVAEYCLDLFQRLVVHEQGLDRPIDSLCPQPMTSLVAKVLPPEAAAWVRDAEDRLRQPSEDSA